MLLETIKIENFRSFKEQTITFDKYTCFVGENGVGKSTVLSALNVLFRQVKGGRTDFSKLTIDDFHHKNTDNPIRITATFGSLSNEAKEDLKDYVRHGKLIFSAVAKFDSVSQRAEVKQYGQRLAIKDFAVFFEEDKAGKTVAHLKTIFKELASKYPDIGNPGTRPAMIDAIHAFEEANPDLCELLPSEDRFYGVSGGKNILDKYIHWVFIPAAKDIGEDGIESKGSALGDLLSRTVRAKINFTEKITELQNTTRTAYKQILDQEQRELEEISKRFNDRISSWSHPDASATIEWNDEPEKTVKINEPIAVVKMKERGFEGQLHRFGHGLQRSYLLAILQELASLNTENVPMLLLGIEEPEIYQHPPQIRFFVETLTTLADSNNQILVCTHNPLFVPSDEPTNLRIIKSEGAPSESVSKSFQLEDLRQKLVSVGQDDLKPNALLTKLYTNLLFYTNEMFFCRVPVFVEGLEDVAYFMTFISLIGRMKELRKLGLHFIPTNNKTNIIKPLAITKLLEIQSFVVFDADTDKVKNGQDVKHKKDNKAIIQLQGHNLSEWPTSDSFVNNLVFWKENLGNSIRDSIGPQVYESLWHETSAEFNNAPDIQKNPLAITRFLEKAFTKKINIACLEQATKMILDFGRGLVPSYAQVTVPAVVVENTISKNAAKGE